MELIVISPDSDNATKVKLLDRLLNNSIPQAEQEALRRMIMTGLKMDFSKKTEVIRQNPTMSQKEGTKIIKEIIWYSYLTPLAKGDKALANDEDKMIAKAQEILDEIVN